MKTLIPCERTVNRNNRSNGPSPKTITAANKQKNYKLAKAATLLPGTLHCVFSGGRGTAFFTVPLSTQLDKSRNLWRSITPQRTSISSGEGGGRSTPGTLKRMCLSKVINGQNNKCYNGDEKAM